MLNSFDNSIWAIPKCLRFYNAHARLHDAGIVHAMLYAGVGVGYVLGGAALNLYVDFDRVPKDQ